MENSKLDSQKLIGEILSNSTSCGIASDEVNLAKNLVLNKCEKKDLFVVEGLWATDKLIEKKLTVTHFFFCGEKLSEYSVQTLEKIAKLSSFAQKSYSISIKACKKISDRDGYDEFFVVVKQIVYSFSDIEKIYKNNQNVLAMVMDGLEQPGNIGAILRSFDSAGGDFAIITNKQARLTNSRLVRASLGASFMIPVLEADIDETQKWLEKQNFKCIVTDLTGKISFKDADYSGKIAIIAGNEHTGISPSWRQVKNSTSVIIPMLGSVESLNVGFASTLVAYEAGLKKFGNKKTQK